MAARTKLWKQKSPAMGSAALDVAKRAAVAEFCGGLNGLVEWKTVTKGF